MTRFTLTTLVTLLFALGAFALDEPPPAIQPEEEALQRTAQLRAEAAAHQEMGRQFAATTGSSRRERRWRRTVIALCREYAATAIRTAEAYERAAAPASPLSPVTTRHETLTSHGPGHLPLTSVEYEARAAEYDAQAKSLRADADRHITMLRSSIALQAQQQPYSTRSSWVRRGVFFEPPREQAARERCQNIVQHSLDLARHADDVAKHYRLRARELEARR